MKCVCCGRRKKWRESFENIGEGVDICVECSKLLYKYQDAIRADNKEAESYLKEIKCKKSTSTFDKWLSEFEVRVSAGVKVYDE